ncbi:hypothetical protein DL96DRAFT_1623484 [Flagelloscypha sp. PMI_526]|nr:hypothetical protein DL96DRAFT_1623484 [Flagelloscypha sp. PMI_526]
MSITNSQRSSLVSEIASLEARLLVLRSQLNTLSAINCLPTDVLLEIIKLVRGAPTSNFGWIRGITDVCSHWRSIALCRRELWATIFLSPKHVKQRKPIYSLLSRADCFPLTLHAPSSSLLVDNKKIERFGIRIQALRGLYIGTCSSPYDLAQIFHVEDNIEAPSLQTLHVDICTAGFQAVPRLTAFLSKRCPSLRRLRIPSLSFDSKDVQELTVSDLSLVEVAGRESGIVYSVPSPSYDVPIQPYDIFASLIHCRSLRHLTLTALYLKHYESFSPSVALNLPLLRSLTLEKANIRSAIKVLQFISSQSALDVTCTRMELEPPYKSVDHGGTEIQLLSELVKCMLGHSRSHGSRLFLYTTKRRGDRYIYGIRLEGNAHPHLDVTVSLPSACTPEELYSALLAPLDPASFSHVSFGANSLKIASLPFFCACSATSFNVVHWGNLDGLSLASPPGVTMVPLPHLENIEVEDVSWSDLTGLVSTLWWRFRKGLLLPRLVLVETDESDLDETTRTLLPLITNGTFLTESSADTQQLPALDVDNCTNHVDDDHQDLSERDEETSSEEDPEEYSNEGKESGDIYGAWLLRPDVALLEDEESGDDYSPTGFDMDLDSD